MTAYYKSESCMSLNGSRNLKIIIIKKVCCKVVMLGKDRVTNTLMYTYVVICLVLMNERIF